MRPTLTDINYKIELSLEKYSDMVRRICFLYLHNYDDVNDVFQEVFLKLLQKSVTFENDEHEKAWLIKVTINKCKDMLKSFWHKKVVSIENLEFEFEEKIETEVLQVVLSLQDKYKEVIYLYFYEGYSVPEISKLLNKRENTVYSLLRRAKAILKQKLGGNDYDYSF